MSDDLPDLHVLDPDEFIRRVHSFEHWFEAVEGYLGDLEHGHRSDLEPSELPADEREELVSILCNYSVAETAALEASGGLIRIAPNQHCKIFLSTQVVDEGRHIEVVHGRLEELGVEDPEAEVERRASQSIRDFHDKLLALVDAREWDSAIFAQNVILEAMEFTVFAAHIERADPVTRDCLERMLRDERRHIGFGENELGRRLRADPRRRRWIKAVKEELDPLVLATFEQTLAELKMPRWDRPELGRSYLNAVQRLGLV